METGTETAIVEETSPEVTTVETPTKSEAEVSLEAQIAEMQKTLEQKDESYKGLQRTLNKTNDELKKRGDVDARLGNLDAKLKILAAMQAKNTQKDIDLNGLSEGEKVDYLKQFDDIETQQRQKQQIGEVQQKILACKERVEALGLTPDDPEYWDVEDAAAHERFEKAEALLKRLEKQKGISASAENTKKEGDKVTDFEATVKAEVDKRVAEASKANPLLRTDEALPSGRAKTAEETLEKFASGDSSVSFDDYSKAREQLGYNK